MRRAQDMTNPCTSHCDIMLLAKRNGENGSEPDHPFMYTHILRIYHANIIYTGEGMVDYQPQCVEFLWVQWFEYDSTRSIKWKDLKLDAVTFLPVESEDMFGFVHTPWMPHYSCIC
jgi:hypothetical protein